MDGRSTTLSAVLLSTCLLAVGLSGCGGGSSGGEMCYEDFTIAWDADTQTMSVVRSAEPRDVEGEYVRLSSSDVQWNGGTNELSGDVTLTNKWSGQMSAAQCHILNYDPSDQSISDDGAWHYDAMINSGASDTRTWTITDPNAVDFTFTVRVYHALLP